VRKDTSVAEGVMHYAWFMWSAFLTAIWAAVYLSIRNPQSRREMLIVSFWTSLLGLTEFLFVPAYWTPPSLFDLARKIHFDVESLLFSFAIGGLAVVIYEWFFPVRHLAMSNAERHLPRHRFHILALLSAPVIFLLLTATTTLNPIYSTILALAGGGVCACYCRPDLIQKMLASAILFLGLYFFYFLSLVAVYPDYVREVWNLRAISGILILGIPLEELLFAFALGFMWSSVYEHLKWQRVRLFKERQRPTLAHR
jgi:Lycopene cyclase